MTSGALKYLLWGGCLFFLCMATAHFFGIKVPVMFVYYDTPYYSYQDKIIAFAVTAYAALFFVATQNRSIVPVVLIVMAITVLGLSNVNMSGDLKDILVVGQSTKPYWIQTILLGIYSLILAYFYKQSSE